MLSKFTAFLVVTALFAGALTSSASAAPKVEIYLLRGHAEGDQAQGRNAEGLTEMQVVSAYLPALHSALRNRFGSSARIAYNQAQYQDQFQLPPCNPGVKLQIVISAHFDQTDAARSGTDLYMTGGESGSEFFADLCGMLSGRGFTCRRGGRPVFMPAKESFLLSIEQASAQTPGCARVGVLLEPGNINNAADLNIFCQGDNCQGPGAGVPGWTSAVAEGTYSRAREVVPEMGLSASGCSGNMLINGQNFHLRRLSESFHYFPNRNVLKGESVGDQPSNSVPSFSRGAPSANGIPLIFQPGDQIDFGYGTNDGNYQNGFIFYDEVGGAGKFYYISQFAMFEGERDACQPPRAIPESAFVREVISLRPLRVATQIRSLGGSSASAVYRGLRIPCVLNPQKPWCQQGCARTCGEAQSAARGWTHLDVYLDGRKWNPCVLVGPGAALMP